MQIPNEIPAVTAYLANAAWLVVLLAILAELATRLLRPMPAAILHRVWVGCLALAVLLPSLAFLRGNPPAPATITTSRHARLEDETALTGAALPHNKAGKSQADAVPVKHPAMRTSFPNWWSRDGEYLLSFVYLATVLFASMRLIVGLRRAILLQHEGIEATLPAELQRVWERSLERSGVANVRLLASRIANPATLTLGAPVILLPSDMSLTAPAEMAAAFCHELAHVRRNDFLKNLSYEALAALLYFHPAMHWIRRRVQETRELACDDLAAAAIGDRRGYAESLVRLAKGNFEPILRTGYSLGIFDGNVMEE